jgi:anti-sigma regulatory factor (Ser/Thr protein kinase)
MRRKVSAQWKATGRIHRSAAVCPTAPPVDTPIAALLHPALARVEQRPTLSAMPHAEVTLPAEASSVPTARHFVESILTSWGHPEQGWAAALLVSELSANCTLHARTAFTVGVELTPDEVRLQVSDGSLRAPALRDYSNAATTGRGLRLVDEVSAGWGVDLHDQGKTVWAVLRLDEQGTADDDDEAETDLDTLLAAFGEEVEDRGIQGTQLHDLSWRIAA